MKIRYLLLVSVLALVACDKNDSGDVPNSQIKDPVFRKFCVQMYDRDGDGILSAEELAAVREIVCHPLLQDEDGNFLLYSYTITTLEGIEHFPNLQKIHFEYLAVQQLNLSGNRELEEVRVLHSYLNVLDVNRNPSLKVLNVSDCRLKNLDVSDNIDLEVLYCAENRLTQLNIRRNPKLRSLETLFNFDLRTIYVPADFDPETTELQYSIDDWTSFQAG